MLNPAQQAALSNQQSNANSAGAVTHDPPPGTGSGTSVAAWLAHYGRALITLPYSGNQLEVQALPPGDYLSVYGSAFNAIDDGCGIGCARPGCAANISAGDDRETAGGSRTGQSPKLSPSCIESDYLDSGEHGRTASCPGGRPLGLPDCGRRNRFHL